MKNALRKFGFITVGLLVAVIAIARPVLFSDAAVATPPRCAGNICDGVIIVGGQTVSYSFTQHVRSTSSSFKLRLNGGTYSTVDAVSYLASGLPVFDSVAVLANPTGGIALPDSVVNPSRTAYERRAPSGVSGQVVDQVMIMNYAALAAGSYSFNLSVTQNGQTGLVSGLVFYSDATAPTGNNESFAWATVPNMNLPCADGRDNDLDFKTDCADSQCAGRVGDLVLPLRCELTETTCNDEFDNDGDSLTDCLDANCNGRVGEPFGTALCQYDNEFGVTSCADNFDNDGDGLDDCRDNLATDSLATHACWKQSGYGCPATELCALGGDNDRDASYTGVWDDLPSSGAQCMDYDCKGTASCPQRENQLADGTAADSQCFDGLDNDLDGLFDCADTDDCTGAISELDPNRRCYSMEFDLGNSYQYCANSFDDDGDSGADCADSDCQRRFGNCGPCPDREDITYDSCADTRDNDTDAGADCADANCYGRIGQLEGAAVCSMTENTLELCSDELDNNANGVTDCEDPSCNGLASCQFGVETSCTDRVDNDLDDYVDCADTDCFGTGACPSVSTIAPACLKTPVWSGPMAFMPTDPTIFANVVVRDRVSVPHAVNLTGNNSYSSVTFVIGDNTGSPFYYQYAAFPPNCQLSGPSAGVFSIVPVAGRGYVLQYTGAVALNGFDLSVSCTTPAAPGTFDYPVSLSALRSPYDVPEFGDLSFNHERLEGVGPIVESVFPESGPATTIRIPYGASHGVRFRAKATDPAPDSGICRCEVDISVNAVSTVVETGGDCVTDAYGFVDEGVVSLRARAEDGAANVGAWSAPTDFSLNVTPVVSEELRVFPSKPFFRNGRMSAELDAEFITATTDVFGASCNVYIRDSSGVLINGPVGPTASFAGLGIGNVQTCLAGNFDLSPYLPIDGAYYVSIRVSDSDGDSAETARRAVYLCNNVPGPGDPESVCSWADFDGDGATEGLYSTTYGTTPLACDNCVGLPNPNQYDDDANGIGDVCEADQEYGRCEIDREVVCSCHSYESCAYPCPAPSNGMRPDSDPPAPASGTIDDPHLCRDPWGTCTLNGEICFENTDCPGGPGVCEDSSGGPAVSCYEDLDCVAAGLDPAVCIGADACETMKNPWLQTLLGNVFSEGRVLAAKEPPENLYNATYCIRSGGTILNFVSEQCDAQVETGDLYRFPNADNRYTTVLGRIDVAGLRSGRYGTVVEVSSGNLDAVISSQLGGRVYRITGDVTTNGFTVDNAVAASGESGAGTILVDGGNLYINGNVTYGNSTAASPRALASLGWIVLGNDAGEGGNIYIDKSVTELAGNFYSGGTDGVWTVAPPDIQGPEQLKVLGLMLAHRFHFGRSYKSLTGGSEQITFDGRAIANPPPGFADIGKSLPDYLYRAP